MPSRLKNLQKQRFGRWLIIEDSGQTSNSGKSLWLCRCDCGTERLVAISNIINGGTISCGCYSEERKRTQSGLGAINKLFLQYQDHAKRRHIAFVLTRDQLQYITSLPCYYCGIQPNAICQQSKSTLSYTYNGIDRINNDDGYTLENSVPCCKNCNSGKHTLTASDYIALCHRVSQRHALD